MKQTKDLIGTMAGLGRVVLFLLMVALLIPVALAYKRLFPARAFDVPRFFHKRLLTLLGIRVTVEGIPSRATPVLFVCNHVSYLDIPVLGSLLEAGFVAKSEVAGWPLFGFLSRVQNTIFIERRSTRAASQRTQLQSHLAKRQSLILFPEGTSSEGLTVLPFKSTLFSTVEDSAFGVEITVQPVSLTCVAYNGQPMGLAERDAYAWYGDMTLTPHLWEVFKHGAFTVEVLFHPPLTAEECLNRKQLAALCQAKVGQGIAQSLKNAAE